MPDQIDALYARHLETLQARYREVLTQAGIHQAVITAGDLQMRYEDDQAHPFKPYPLAQQWLPFVPPPGTFVIVTVDAPPMLLFPAQKDFWHLTPQLMEGPWRKHWRIQEWQTDVTAGLRDLTGAVVAWLGPQTRGLDVLGESAALNPAAVLSPLHYARAVKTDWEIHCLEQASRSAVAGHRAAAEAFHAGQPEALIHHAYLSASRQVAEDEPYHSIIGLNEAAATLHYERRRFEAPAEHRTLLIDAGAQYLGYASDITRTTTSDRGLFAELLQQVDALQQVLCRRAVAGIRYPDLHDDTLRGIATILHDSGLCRHDVDTQLAHRIPQVFFPHGLGHLLGLQVHDVGGHWQSPQADVQRPPEHAPALRLTRILEAGMALTIEPGLYFIPMLLDRMVKDNADHGCDLGLIESLRPFGGIRIEDNLIIGDGKSRNLTREAFAL
ncbi:MAG: Xaa-Pro dipeptidase [Natronospirillum sp.]|uniref:Xaa-Pro dipeptidase n=1 Tax=Natronospirillum sp. TaxID=2812955 RepID=UPI0025EA3058|nr:Xaa-Pro dipeptidase [Natronospirillum sp.]MCH8552609.1 Xaa-Pro dipeptidase [Natronospirillum sp.]